MAKETELERLVVRLLGDGKSYFKMFSDAEVKATRAQQVIKNAGDQLEAVGHRMIGIGGRMSLAITTPLTVMGGAAVREFGKFDQAMTESTSIMQVTEAQIESMRDMALSLSGKELVQGPDEIARSYFFLASAGKNAEQSMALLPKVAKFATAGAFDMALATDLLTDAQSALGMTSKDIVQDQSNMTRLSDVLVKANTLANASVQQFSESLTNTAGASLKSYNKDVEEGVALLAAYADQGIKGQVAGTNLTRVTLLLSKASRDSAEAHKELGFSVFDSDGKMRNFADIVQNLEEITAGMSDELKSATLEALGFEARIQQAILPILGSSEAIRRYEAELRKAGGTTEEVANNQLKSFNNQMKAIWNQLKVIGIGIGETLLPVVQSGLAVVQVFIDAWQSLTPVTQGVLLGMAGLVAAIGPLLVMLGTLTMLTGAVMKNLTAMGGAARLASMSMATLKVAGQGLVGLFVLDAAVKFFQFIRQQVVEFNKEANDARDTVNKMFDERLASIGMQPLEQQKESLDLMLSGAEGQYQEALKSYNELVEKQNNEGFLSGVRRQTAKSLFGADELEQAKKDLETAKQQLDKIQEMGRSLPDQGNTAGKSPFVLGQGATAASGPSEDAQKQFDEFINGLESQVDLFGLSGREAEIYKMKLAGIPDEQIKIAEGFDAMLSSLEVQKDLDDAAKQFTESLKFQAATVGMTSNEIELYRLKSKGASEEQILEAEKALESLNMAQSSFKELETQTNKDYIAKLGVTGVDQVAAGSSEALNRIAQFASANAFVNTSSPEFQQPKTNATGPNGENKPGVNSPELLSKISTGINRLVELMEQEVSKPSIDELETASLS